MTYLRWVGSKADQVEELLARLPRPLPRHYAEPFVGAGALFFALRQRFDLAKHALLSDTNERLIRCHRAVRDNPRRVCAIVERYPVTKDFYMSARKWLIDAGTDVEVAAWLIYVNHAGYGGLYRVNSKGVFNVPFDTDRAGRPWQGQERVLAASMALGGVDLEVLPFVEAMRSRRPNTLQYLDPPYLQAKSSDFARGYTSKGFDYQDHVQLAEEASAARNRGNAILASNSEVAAPIWQKRGFRVELIEGGRQIGRSKNKAGTTTAVHAPEMLARS
jgi:DNA adenine methylase